MVLPIRNDIVDLRKNIFKQREELEKIYLRGQLLKKMQIQLKDIEEDIPSVESAVLPVEKRLYLITALENISSENKLKQEISMDDFPENISKITALPINVKLNGTFNDFLKYIIDVERMDFYINWQTISIGSGIGTKRTIRRGPNLAPSAPESITENKSIQITLSGQVYWRP